MWSRIVNQSYRPPGPLARVVALGTSLSSGERIWTAVAAIGRSIIQQAKVPHVYFVLALLDLLAVGTGLYLNSQVNQAFAKAVQINSAANKRLEDSEAIRELAKAVIGPSHNVFQSKNVERELASFERSASEITRKAALFRISVLEYSDASRSELKNSVLERIGTIEMALQPPMVQVSCDFSLGDSKAAFDVDYMRGVIVNLLRNTSQAMVGKSTDASCVLVPNPTIRVATRRTCDKVEIAITDNRPRIAEADTQRIVEPLFATKPFGTGLGLWVVEKILEHHGLRIKSKLGEGTAMTAWFPVAQRERKAA
jgi:signal transduction histidine kinase